MINENEFEGICDQCGEKKMVTIEHDPYIEEIHGEITPDENWCEDCYKNACDEI